MGVSATRQRVGGRGDCEAALDVSLGETVSSADLGGSRCCNERLAGDLQRTN